MRQHHRLGETGGTRGVLDVDDVVSIQCGRPGLQFNQRYVGSGSSHVLPESKAGSR